RRGPRRRGPRAGVARSARRPGDRAGDERAPGEPAAELVRLAAGAEARGRREERQCGDEQGERGADGAPAERVGERRRAEHGRSHDVREAGWARVLERALAETRLHELEVRDARQAVPPAEDEADYELQREHGGEPVPA